MKKRIRIAFVCLLALLIAGCTEDAPAETETTVSVEVTEAEIQPALPETQSTVPTVPETVPEQSQWEETTAETAQPAEDPHSPFYIPGVDVEEVIRCFNEVSLDAEVVNSGNPRVLQKWVEPIYYVYHGEYTPEDLNVLYDFCSWLNTVEGFPGIYQTQDPDNANLNIYFCREQELISRMGKGFTGMDGAVTFWYLSDEIYSAIVCCRSDVDQYLRNSVIQEEIYNGLGPIQDTELREDSIIYAGYSEPQSLTEMDRVILKLLYHPDMLCGMDAAACADVIRRLYY